MGRRSRRRTSQRDREREDQQDAGLGQGARAPRGSGRGVRRVKRMVRDSLDGLSHLTVPDSKAAGRHLLVSGTNLIYRIEFHLARI